MRTEKEIIDMLVQLAYCNGNEEDSCPFFDKCYFTEDTCREEWTKWLLKEMDEEDGSKSADY